MPRRQTPARATTPATRPKTEDELIADLGRQLANLDTTNPDPKALADMCVALDKVPHMWTDLIDVGRSTRDSIIKQMGGGALMQKGIQRQAMTMRDGMGYDASPALERGLIEHVVACWLRLQQVEHVYSGVMSQASVVLTRADWCERRLTAAQRRYLRACESLARVRRLTRPAALQVNIGGQQINVADRNAVSGAPTGDGSALG